MFNDLAMECNADEDSSGQAAAYSTVYRLSRCPGPQSSRGVSYEVVCTGVPAVIGTMMECLKVRGRAAQVGIGSLFRLGRDRTLTPSACPCPTGTMARSELHQSPNWDA